MQQLQRLDQFRDAARAGKPEPAQERLRAGVRPGDGRRVAVLRRPSLGRAARLHDHHRHVSLPRAPRQRFEARDGMETGDVQADGAHPRIVEQRQRQAGHIELCLVAGRDHVRDRQCALLHGHADGDVRGLGDDRDTPFGRVEPPAAVLVGPQRRSVEVVDKAVAIRADDRHARRRIDQVALQPPAVGRLKETRRVADGAARPQPRQRRYRIDGGMPVNAHEGGVGRAGERVDGAESPPSSDGFAGRMHRPQGAIETHPVALLGHARRRFAADDRNAARAQEPGHARGGARSRSQTPSVHILASIKTKDVQAPSGRSSSRPMMWR